MKTRLISGIIMMMALVACTQEEMLNNEFGLKKLKTEVEGYHTSSRVGFTDKDAAFFWTKGDKIGVTTSNSSTFQGMTLSGDGGSATGDFSGSMSGNPSGYAVYPYGQMGRHSVNNDELTYTLPASYTYKTLDATYAKADGNSYNAPMWGKVNNGSVSFKHLSGVIAFEVNGLPENTSGKFILTASNKINGTFTANLKDSEPVITSEATDVPAEKTITISFTTAEGQNKGYFYVPVPIGSLGNLMLAIVDGDENEIASGAWDNITINRKDIKRAVIGEQSITGGMVREIEGIDEITNEILTSEEEELIVQITEEVSGTENTIILPQTLQTEVTTFSFASVAEGAAITIQNAADASYSGKIIIEIPENETIPTVTANIPDGEVYIKQGTVTKLVTSSADNTTIIGAKAMIGTLIVQKGNVRIEDGGKVTTIQRSEDNQEMVYVIYESATAPTITLGQGVSLVSAAEFDLRQAAKNGGTYTLTDNVTLSDILVIENPLVLDGNGKTLTSTAGRAINVSGADGVTIKNLTINATGERAINIIQNATNVTIDNVTATAANYAVNVASSASEAVVNITNSDLTGLNVINIGASGAQIAVNQTKITCNDQTDTENYGAIALNADATNANVVATGVTFDIKGDSKQVSNGATGATVSINGANVPQNAVAKIEYGAYYHSFETIEGAISKAKPGETVKLIADVTASSIIVVDKSITLDGNGYKLTSTAERAINVSGADGVTIQNLTINATGQRAINIIQSATNVTIDYVIATAANYTVNVAGSAPSAKVEIKNSILSGLCTVNVSAASADVEVDNSTINCNDNNTTAGEAYAALSLNKDAVGGKITATNTTINVVDGSDSFKGRNGAENGTVTINGSTADVVVMVAYITYPGSDYYHAFATLAKAVEFAKEGDVISLLRDIEISETIVVEKAVTIDLNGKTVTANCKKAFEVYADVTIENGTIISQQRCVDTRTNVNLTLTDVTLKADTYYLAYGNQQPLTIGGSTNGTKVSMTNVTIDAGYQGYAIISFVKTELTAINSTLNGYAALYVKEGSDASQFNFNSSTLSGTTGSNDVDDNSFATIAIEANNVKVTLDANSNLNSTGDCHTEIFIIEGVTGSSVSGPGVK